jgi:hypothetical protein
MSVAMGKATGEKKFFSPRELQIRWGMSKAFVNRLIHAGRVDGRYQGRVLRVTVESVERYEAELQPA